MTPMLLFLVVGSLLVGFLGRHRRIGFLGFFLLSLLVTPLVGVLVLVLSSDNRLRKPAV